VKGRKKKVVEDKTDKLVQTDYFKANNRDTADRAFQTSLGFAEHTRGGGCDSLAPILKPKHY
jgi:hypothetical protein